MTMCLFCGCVYDEEDYECCLECEDGDEEENN